MKENKVQSSRKDEKKNVEKKKKNKLFLSEND